MAKIGTPGSPLEAVSGGVYLPLAATEGWDPLKLGGAKSPTPKTPNGPMPFADELTIHLGTGSNFFHRG